MFNSEALALLVESGGVQYRQNSISYIFNCPRCLKTNKLYIRKKDGRFVCWVCAETQNFKGKAEWALHELLGLRIPELQKKLYGFEITERADVLELDLEDIWGLEESDEIVLEDIPVVKGVEWPPDFVPLRHPGFAPAARYLHGRGVTAQDVITYDIRFQPSEKRVVFPVVVDGDLVGWQGRYIDKTSIEDPETGDIQKIPKILTSTTLRESGSRFVMFQDRLKGSPHVVMAEGPISAIKAGLCGGNVATMGKSVTQRQLDTCLSYGAKKVYLALDRDAAPDILRIAGLLPENVEAYLLLPPDHRDDLGDATQEEVLEQFKKAPRVRSDTLLLSLGSEIVR